MDRVRRIKYSKQQVFSFLSIVIISLSAFYLLSTFGSYFQSQHIQDILKSAGLFAPIIYIAIYVITLVLAPITGYPLFIAAVGLFGITEAIFLSYIASMISATVNYYIAHFFGRRILVKLVGKSGIERIDKLSQKLGVKSLIIGRLFEAFLFEWISYAAGFTQIKFRTYMLVTLWASIPMFIVDLILGFVFTDLGELFLAIGIVNYCVLLIPFCYFGIQKLLGRNSHA